MKNNKRFFIDEYGQKNWRGNWQNIKWTASGSPYVNYKGSRLLLDNFLRCGPETEKRGYCGCYGTSYFSAYLLELSPDGDRARVTYSVC